MTPRIGANNEYGYNPSDTSAVSSSHVSEKKIIIPLGEPTERHEDGSVGNPSNPQETLKTPQDVRSCIKAKLSALENKLNKEEFEKILKEIDTCDINRILKAFTTNYEKIEDVLNKEPACLDVLVKNIQTAAMTGWSIAGFINQQESCHKKGLYQRLAEFKKGKDVDGIEYWEGLCEDERKEAIGCFFERYFEDTKNQDIDTVKKSQLQTFGRILINSTEKEKTEFATVIRNLYKDNIPTGILETFNLMSDDTDIQSLAKALGDKEVFNDIITSKDLLGETMSNNDITRTTHIISAHMTYEDAESFHSNNNSLASEFLKNNKDALDEINKQLKEAGLDEAERFFELLEKSNDKKPLTDDENELLNKYLNVFNNSESTLDIYKEYHRHKSVAAGEFTGIASNTYISECNCKALLQQFNYDNFENGETFYRDVIKSINNYVNHYPEEFKEIDINGLMSEITEGNYSLIINGNSDELTAPQKPNLAKNIGITFNGNPPNEYSCCEHQNYIDALKEYIYGYDNNNQHPVYIGQNNSLAQNDTEITTSNRSQFVKEYQQKYGCSKFKAICAYYRKNILNFVSIVFKDKTLSEFIPIVKNIVASLDKGLRDFLVTHTDSIELAKVIIKHSNNPEQYNSTFISMDVAKVIEDTEKEKYAMA